MSALAGAALLFALAILFFPWSVGAVKAVLPCAVVAAGIGAVGASGVGQDSEWTCGLGLSVCLRILRLGAEWRSEPVLPADAVDSSVHDLFGIRGDVCRHGGSRVGLAGSGRLRARGCDRSHRRLCGRVRMHLSGQDPDCPPSREAASGIPSVAA
jgi:hypothetical protein